MVLTGGRGAIGSATVAALARRRVQVISLTRPSFDLSSLESVRLAARELNRSGTHIDALLNIAAVFLPEFKKTKDGFETMLATNQLGPFLLTNLLRDRLASGGRVITVTAPSTTRVDMDQLNERDRFGSMHSFGATKAANLMFALELARRAKRWDVRSNAFHPGLVRSDLMRGSPGALRFGLRLISRSPRHAGEDLAELAISPAFAGTTGWFFKGLRRIEVPKSALDLGAQGLVWKGSADLVELEAGF